MTVEVRATFASLLSSYRRAAGLTQEELAERAGLSVRGVSDLERGARRQPRAHTVRCLTDALELGADDGRVLQQAAGWLERAKREGENVGGVGAPTNLPAPVTSFVGRAQELDEIGELLRTKDVRLVTLTGTGGCGKTRLAIRVASELLDDFQDGVYLVSLAPVSDSNMVVPAIAAVLDVSEAGDQFGSQLLKAHLKTRSLLLVIDNFEQVTEAAHEISEILGTCPGVKVILTSRTILHLSGEHVYHVPPMSVPDLKSLPPLEVLTKYDSVSLFASRAKGAQHDFEVTSESAQAVAAICCRLDGLPLAIELAAARIRLLTPQAMLDLLTNRLHLVTGGASDAPERHQTLRAAIEWSYTLLAENERLAFRRLSVLVGDWSLAAAEAIIAAEPAAAENWLRSDMLEIVGSLQDKSLIRRVVTTTPEPRFHMLETLREYAAERLEESGEANAPRRRHAEYFIALAEQASKHFEGATQESWLNLLDAEHDNVRAALRFLREESDGLALARLAMAASRFWRIQGHFVEGRLWLETALTSEQLTDEMRGRLLYRAGSLAQRQSDFDASRRLQTSGLRVSKAAGDRENVANCLNGLAVLALSQGDDDQASRYFLESRVEYEAVNDTWGVAACLLNLGNIALGTNQHEEAFRLYTESLQQYRGLGDAALVALCVTCLAGLALGKGEYEEAAVLAAEGLELQPESGDKLEIAYGRRLLGVARGHLGDIGDAIRLVGGAIEACHELGSIDQTIDALREMGGLAALAGNPDGAARLWGAVEALAAGSGLTIDQSDQDRYEYRLVEARGRVDRQTWDTMWRLGQALTLDEAVELALQSCE